MLRNIAKRCYGLAMSVTLGPMPPHGCIEGLLTDADLQAFLSWAIEQEAAFKPAKVFYGPGGRKDRLNPKSRIALKHRRIGPFEPLIRDRLFQHLPQIMEIAGYKGPEPRSIEFELNAYGEGAHFAPHIDIPIGANRQETGEQDGEDRFISAVYYFFREPKAFSGGALRLFRFGVDPERCGEHDSVAFEPVQNRLVVFPSWARHAVERVACKSGDFADHRFALNCWFCRKLSAGETNRRLASDGASR
ncbi:MAG: 2OG-Fe(II) oxygenase [Sphingomicrobium sp.]